MFTGEYSQQPKDRNPNVHKLINGLIKCGIIHKMESFSVIKKKEVLLHATI